MSDIRIDAYHSLDDTALHEIVEQVGDELVRNHGGYTQWQGDVLHYKQPMGVHGTLQWDDSKVRINIKLGLMAGMFRQTIEREVNKVLENKLG